MSGLKVGESNGEYVDEHDGEYIVFTTSQPLQKGDVNGARDVYEWHCASPCASPATQGEVHLISDGRDPAGVEDGEATQEAGATMSATGSDIFFFTRTSLVGQDRDVLRDLYDARIGGGFPAPAGGTLVLGRCMPGERVRTSVVWSGAEFARSRGWQPRPHDLGGGGGRNQTQAEAEGQTADASAAARQGAQGLQGKAKEEARRVRIAGQEEVPQVMLGALERLTGRRARRLLIATISAGALGLTAAPALAAPSWEVTMTQANPFGLQLGKDPFTESGETFAQESGYDAYTIAVKNAGDETAGAAYQSGSTLTCVGGPATGVSLSYRWLRNGQVIEGAQRQHICALSCR